VKYLFFYDKTFLAALEHMNYAHEFIICFVSEERKTLTAIVTAMNQTRRKFIIQVCRPVNFEEKVISITKTFIIPLFIEHGSNYLETVIAFYRAWQ
jgi:hypothetical protein